MLSIRQELIEMLSTGTGLDVYFIMPPINVDVEIPLLILDEVNNTDYFYEQNGLEIVDVSYEISIYAKNPMEVLQYMPLIDNIMKEVGLRRTYTSNDMYVEPLYCKTMQYTGKIFLKNSQHHIIK